MTDPERCARCGRRGADLCPSEAALIHRTRSKHAIEEIEFAQLNGASPVHHRFVPEAEP